MKTKSKVQHPYKYPWLRYYTIKDKLQGVNPKLAEIGVKDIKYDFESEKIGFIFDEGKFVLTRNIENLTIKASIPLTFLILCQDSPISHAQQLATPSFSHTFPSFLIFYQVHSAVAQVLCHRSYQLQLNAAICWALFDHEN